MRYVEFASTSNFSFLRGASHPEELITQAAQLGLAGLGLSDRNSVAGVVRAHVARRESGLTLAYHPGARLVFADDTPDILAYPRDRAAWGRLCRLLTLGNRRAAKGDCLLTGADLLAHAEGLELVVMEGSSAATFFSAFRGASNASEPGIHNPGAAEYGFRARGLTAAPRNDILKLRDAAPGRVRLAASMLYRGDDRARLAKRAAEAREAQVPLIAVNDVLYHAPARRPLQDVLTCIREHLTLADAGRRLTVNAERHLKPAAEMARLFRDYPEAVAETLRLSEQLTFSLDELRYEYPDETREGFATPQEALVHFTYAGAAQRYPQGIPDKVKKSLDYELKLIAELNYAPYFLTVHDIVRYARAQGILCQGRGSAANSAVCFCLGVTEVDPDRIDLLFERFVSAERREPPDIDVDFEHERREEVIQYIYNKYGRERAGLAATVISYRGRSAVREVGKAFALSEDTIGAVTSSIWGGGGGHLRDDDLARAGLDTQSGAVRKMLAMVGEIVSFPRHLSQHVGGFVITRGRLDEVVPIMNAAMEDRTNVEWDKDDLDALGILKIDVLGLGMLTCLRKALDLVERHYPETFPRQTLLSCPAKAGHPVTNDGEARNTGLPAYAGNDSQRLDLSAIPAEDPAVYRMLHARRFARRIPDRKPRADDHAAAAEAGEFLRPRGRSGDRAAGPDPGRHGASLSAAPAGAGAGELSLQGTRSGARQDAGRAAVPGAGDEDRHRRRRFHALGSRPAAPRHGHLPPRRHHRHIPEQDDRRHGRQRLRARFRRALLPPDRGLRGIRLSGKPCGELRAPGLCLGLAQMPLPRRVRRRAAQRAADGLLRAGADRARRARARRRGAPARREFFRLRGDA